MLPRRTVLRAAAGTVVGAQLTRARSAPLSGRKYPLNTGWLFGGGYRPGTEAADFDDSRFAAVTVPHCPVALAWSGWEPGWWEQQWIYRRHIDGGALPPGARVFADFDGVMVSCTVLCNGRIAGQHQGGYLPFSAELTGLLTRRDNVLAVIVDSRCLPVPPMATTQPRGMHEIPARAEPGGAVHPTQHNIRLKFVDRAAKA